MGLSAVLSKKVRTTPPVRLVVISFLMLIIIGALILMLPICSRSGQGTRFMDALFTAVSAVCVTGLTRFDTWIHWNGLGQAVILLLIQLGGLSIITVTTGFSLLLRQKLGLRELSLARENLQGDDLNISHLLRMILTVTFSAEGLGALILMLRFVPQYGLYGIWMSVFHAVSAYCNAGFDLMGFRTPSGSLISYASDPLVLIPLDLLIITGGLGFIVISDIYYAKLRHCFKREKTVPLSLHSTVVLIAEAVLLIVGTAMILGLEHDNTLRNLDWPAKLNTAFFQSNSLRTAGLTAMDTANQQDLTKLISAMLSFIGVAPCSTGGGIKYTTLVVLGAAVLSVLRGSDEIVLRHRRIAHAVVYRSLTFFFGGLLTVFMTTGVLMMRDVQNKISSVDALHEAVAAFSTSGMGIGLTPMLDDPSMLALIFAMFIGRVGFVSLGLSVSIRHTGKPGCVMPEARIIVG
ncbi:TrkH family potassium uptake protein [Faecalispora anaeroviscerum]|uniref:TrkH family potassium uptake protein n=1 Tax=Faecalispora anaeroviscerum TaxID=2991836 RepID=UPI0024B8F8BA|nr:potassium transporter TrkG [Faecalispora anaeroviscerum]